MPLAPLKLEWIGQDTDQVLTGAARMLGEKPKSIRRPWVAAIKGYSWPGKLDREFLDANTDYSEANSKGSRGVYLYFHLAPGEVYEVCHFTSWSNKRRYFCTTDGESIIEMSREEVVEFFAKRAR